MTSAEFLRFLLVNSTQEQLLARPPFFSSARWIRVRTKLIRELAQTARIALGLPCGVKLSNEDRWAQDEREANRRATFTETEVEMMQVVWDSAHEEVFWIERAVNSLRPSIEAAIAEQVTENTHRALTMAKLEPEAVHRRGKRQAKRDLAEHRRDLARLATVARVESLAEHLLAWPAPDLESGDLLTRALDAVEGAT